MDKRKNIFTIIIQHAAIIVLLFMLLYPLSMAVWCSFKTQLDFKYTRWFPTIPLLFDNYSIAFTILKRYIFNTVFVSAVGCSAMIIISSLSAYTFAKLRIYGKEILYVAVLALLMVPSVLSLVPSFMLYKSLGLTNTYWALIIPYTFGGAQFGVFLLRSFFEGLPESIFESARIDGAKEFTVYWKICMPLSLPILGTLLIMHIIRIWNNLVWPLVALQDEKLYTISPALVQKFSTKVGTNYPLTFSGYVLSSIPLILLFVFANRYYVEGLTHSGIKL